MYLIFLQSSLQFSVFFLYNFLKFRIGLWVFLKLFSLFFCCCFFFFGALHVMCFAYFLYFYAIHVAYTCNSISMSVSLSVWLSTYMYICMCVYVYMFIQYYANYKMSGALVFITQPKRTLTWFFFVYFVFFFGFIFCYNKNILQVY